jgi:hypothetical protein
VHCRKIALRHEIRSFFFSFDAIVPVSPQQNQGPNHDVVRTAMVFRRCRADCLPGDYLSITLMSVAILRFFALFH